jgi:hypothetical protein
LTTKLGISSRQAFFFEVLRTQEYNPPGIAEMLEAVMARMVALWRCKCGMHVKVVAEADSSAPGKQIASCPKCHDPHAIHADKIISVTEDTFDISPAGVSCEEKERLLVAQSKAFDLYMRGASELAEAAGTMAHKEFEFLAKRVSAARQSLMETRQQLNEHIAAHGC